MPNYSRGRDLAGRHRDTNAKESKIWYANSEMSLYEIQIELVLTQDRAMQTIRKWLAEIYYLRRLMGINSEPMPSCGVWDEYWILEDYKKEQNGPENT